MSLRVAAVAAAVGAMPLTASSTTTTSPARSPAMVRKLAASTTVRLRPRTVYCSGTGQSSFLGGGAAGTAGGEQSGILAGDSNQACGQFDGIAGGKSNATQPSDTASFMGAGQNNVITGNNSGFIGAGLSNSATANFSGVGAGEGNQILNGTGSAFVGGGANNSVTGVGNDAVNDGFVGAGTNNEAAGTADFLGDGQDGYTLDHSGVVSGDQNAAEMKSFDGAGQQNFAGENGFVFVGAGSHNQAAAENSFVGAGTHNVTGGEQSFIGAGSNNFTGADGIRGAGTNAFVGAGSQNTAVGQSAFIGGGYNGIASGAGAFLGAGGLAFFQAGSTGKNSAAGIDAFVSAGDGNVAGTAQSVITGGVSNRILHTTAGGTTGAVDAVIGGHGNIIEATASGGAAYAVLAGGETNLVTGAAAALGGGGKNAATGSYATVPGGFENHAAGIGSFAAGTNAGALHDGTFVWSDDAGSAALNSSAPYQFLARASGGFSLYSNATATAGVELAPGSGAWSSLSDRSMKTAIRPLAGATALENVVTLPVSEWSYTSENGVRHVGPMAQDFYAAFGVGEDDRHITTIDEDGVALAAIKSLYAKSERNNAIALRENETLRAHISQERREIAALTAKVSALVKHEHAFQASVRDLATRRLGFRRVPFRPAAPA